MDIEIIWNVCFIDKGISEIIENETKEQEGVVPSMLLGAGKNF